MKTPLDDADRWPHRRNWLWTAPIHAIGLLHVDPHVGEGRRGGDFQNVRRRDCFIPHMATRPPSPAKSRSRRPRLAFAVGLVKRKA
jgi:hypothetical protein